MAKKPAYTVDPPPGGMTSEENKKLLIWAREEFTRIADLWHRGVEDRLFALEELVVHSFGKGNISEGTAMTVSLASQDPGLPLIYLMASTGSSNASECIQWFDKAPPWALQTSNLGTYPSWDDVRHLSANIDRSIIAFRYNMGSTGYLATIDRDDWSITTLGTVTATSTNFTSVIVDPLGVWVGTGNPSNNGQPALHVRRIDTGATLFNSANYVSYIVDVSPEGDEVAVANGSSGADVRIYNPLSSWNEDTSTYDFDDIDPTVVGTSILQRVWSVAYSPDGQYLATGQSTYLSAYSSSWNPLLFWDRATGNRVTPLTGLPAKPSDANGENNYRVRDIKFSPDGSLVAFCFQGSGVQLEFGWNIGVWNMSTGEFKYKLATGEISSTHYIVRLDWSPDGKYLAGSGSGSPYGDCPVVWDMDTGLLTSNDDTIGAVSNSNSVVFI
jgi:WD40 repeat protein